MLAIANMMNVAAKGEKWVYDQLVLKGYNAQFMPVNCANCDILITGDSGQRLPIEVKFARPTSRKAGTSPRWQFYISDTASDMIGDWVLVLVCQDSNKVLYPFIIPGQLVSERPHIQITSHPKVYRGWMSRYLNRWDVIDYLLNQEYRNGGLLEQLEAA